MSIREYQLTATAAELKRAFDETFAQPPPLEVRSQDDFLAISISDDPYAIRLREIATLLSDRKITWLPGSPAGLMGILGLRGTVVPVYDLRVLLGYPPAPLPRWFVIAAAKDVALAFDRFEGHLRVTTDAVAVESQGASQQSPHARAVLRSEAGPRPVVDVASLLDHIAGLARQRPGRKGNE